MHKGTVQMWLRNIVLIDLRELPPYRAFSVPTQIKKTNENDKERKKTFADSII